MNEELARQISQNNIDIDYFVNIILKDKQLRNEIVDIIINHPKAYYYGYIILDKATELNPKLFYKYWDEFAKLLNHKNTYHRQIGIVILSNLSKVDKDDNFSKIIDNYLKCLYDKKIHIGVYTTKYLKEIIKNKPQYREKIINELLHHREETPYSQKQEALLEYGILEIFENIYNEIEKKENINAFIIDKQESISPKTKKKSKEMIRKLGIK